MSVERGATVRLVLSSQNATDFTEVVGDTKMATDPVSVRPWRSSGLVRFALVLTFSFCVTAGAGLLTVNETVRRSTVPFARNTSTVSVWAPLSSSLLSNMLAVPFDQRAVEVVRADELRPVRKAGPVGIVDVEPHDCDTIRTRTRHRGGEHGDVAGDRRTCEIDGARAVGVGADRQTDLHHGQRRGRRRRPVAQGVESAHTDGVGPRRPRWRRTSPRPQSATRVAVVAKPTPGSVPTKYSTRDTATRSTTVAVSVVVLPATIDGGVSLTSVSVGPVVSTLTDRLADTLGAKVDGVPRNDAMTVYVPSGSAPIGSCATSIRIGGRRELFADGARDREDHGLLRQRGAR